MMSTTVYVTTEKAGLVERTSTLSIITVVAFISNLLLLVTIGQSASLRTKPFNQHIVNISIINMLTSILALPMAIGYTATDEWDYGSFMCKVLAHFVMTTAVAMCLGILAMNVDRVIAISKPARYGARVNSGKTALLIILTWLTAILFPLPLSLGVVLTEPYQNRYICSIAGGSSLNYLLSLYSICFALPAVVNILIFVYIGKETLSEKEAESTGSRARSTSELWPEVQSAGVVLILFVLWAVCELPYITLTSIEQYIHSDQVAGHFSYSATLDTAFTWLKFCNCCLLPFVSFKWRKDIWFKFKDLMFCRKSNSILDASPRQEKNNGRSRFKQSQQSLTADTPKFEASFPIPTIKATKDGLHVHGNADDDDEIFYADLDMTGRVSQFDGIRTIATVHHHEDNADGMQGR